MKLQYEAEITSQKKKQKLLDNIEDSDKVLDLEDDTYTMAFKALNWQCMKEMDLNNDEVQDAFQAAVTVFFVQAVLIVILAFIVFSSADPSVIGIGMPKPFEILLPTNLSVLGARFICSILMHL